MCGGCLPMHHSREAVVSWIYLNGFKAPKVLTGVRLSRDNLLMVLMHLRIFWSTLTFLCPVSVTTSRDGLTRCLLALNVSLSGHQVKSFSPTCVRFLKIFISKETNNRLVWDFIERPCSCKARAQAYSNYRKHNTVKFLVKVSLMKPFLFFQVLGRKNYWQVHYSELWFPAVWWTRRLNVSWQRFRYCRSWFVWCLSWTTFLHRGKQQLCLQKVEHSERHSKGRIHIERVIGILKNQVHNSAEHPPYCLSNQMQVWYRLCQYMYCPS